MIQVKEKFQILADDSMDSAKFSLKEENLAHVFNILRNNLYSDKILAVIREYSTNAHDANVEVGRAEKPILVTLPTIVEPTFKVRDYGHGLSKNDIFNVFSSYGASTKRNTNKLIGTLGMGSKSGFAYQPSFTVTSYYDGKKSIYEAYIDETDLGTISLLHEEETSEETGLEITIAVHKDDIHKFKQKAIDFYAWFKPYPVFAGVNIITEITRDKFANSKILYNTDDCVLYRDGSYKSDPTILVNMGNICYPVTNFENIDADWLNGHTLVLKVKLGEVTFTTSRESLEMKKPTIDVINNYIQQIKKNFTDELQAEIDACENSWKVICKYCKYGKFETSLIPKLSYQGTELSLKNIASLNYTMFNVNNSQWKKIDNDKPWFNNSGIILNDGGFPASHISHRLKAARSLLFKAGVENIYYIKTATTQEAKDISELIEFNGIKKIMLSSVDSNVQKKSYTKGTFDKNEKYFVWNKRTDYPYSNCWTSVKPDENKTCVYVEIDNFKPLLNGRSDDAKTLWDKLTKINNRILEYDKDFKLYGIRKTQLNNLPSNWIPLKEYLLEVLKNILENQDYIDTKVIKTINENLNRNWFLGCVMNLNYESLKDEVECPVFKEILEIPSSLNSKDFNSKELIIAVIRNTYGFNDLIADFNSKIAKIVEDKTKEINDKINYCIDSYPLINGLETSSNVSNSYARVNDKTAKHLVDYSNLVHRSSKQLQMTV